MVAPDGVRLVAFTEHGGHVVPAGGLARLKESDHCKEELLLLEVVPVDHGC